MPFPPIEKTMEGLLRDHETRVTLVERRLAIGGSGSSVPYDANPGMVMPFSGTTIPDGWLACDGAAVSRAAYPELFTVVGTTYGAGDGSTTFNVPNYKGRVLVGQDVAQTEFDVLGEVGGAKTHTLTIAEMPAHSHQWNAAGTNNPGGVPANWDDIVGANSAALGVGPTSPEAQGNAIVPRGGGGAHNNLQPYAVAKYIISTGQGVGGGSARATSSGSGTIQPGVITPYAGATVPTGWLLCDGAAVSRAGFPGLFAAIGTAYGAGDGSTTFNVPNLKGKVPVGADATQTEFDVLGETGGAKTVTIVQGNLPGPTIVDAATPNNSTDFGLKFASTAAYTAKSLTALGQGGTPTNNLQPYVVTNYIISTGGSSSASAPAVLPVNLWQEFTLDQAGVLVQPIVGGAVVWNGPITGNLGATLDATKGTIRLPEAGTYRILTHVGYGAGSGSAVSGAIYIGGGAYPPSFAYGNANTAAVFVADTEITITTTGPITFTQGAVAGNGIYRWTWLRIEKLEPFYPKSTVLAVTQGSTALRDSIYGVPTVAADQASLANRMIAWFNTDKGWFETYYAVTGTAGLTAKGLLSGHSAGWYPAAGSLLSAKRSKTDGYQAVISNGNSDVALAASTGLNRGGFVDSGICGLLVPYGGLYRVNCTIYYTGGTGPASSIVWAQVFSNGAVQLQHLAQRNAIGTDIMVPLQGMLVVAAGKSLDLVANTNGGSVSVYGITPGYQTFLEVQYLGPPLVNG